MKSLIYVKSAFAALALAALCPLSAQDGAEQEPQPVLSDASTASLLGLVDGTSTGALSSEVLSLREGETGTEVLLVIHSTEGDAGAELAESLLSDGLIAEARYGAHPEYMRAWVPDASVSSLKDNLAGYAPGASMSYYRRPVANSSEGARAMLADKYHATGLRGAGVKVAIMDIGFAGAPDLLRGDDLGFDIGSQPDSDSSHGAAMYEVLKGMAPEAEYLGLELNEDLDVFTATIHALNWGADVIVSPLTWFELPGEGLAVKAAALATENHVLWVNAAGNFGDGAYWESYNPAITMINGEYYLSADSEVIDADQAIGNLNQGQMFEIHFAHEIAPTSPARLALELWAGDGEAAERVAEADATSNVQKLAFIADGRQFFARIRLAEIGDVMGMRMFAPGLKLGHSSRAGSIANPATLPQVLSVGAMPHEQYGQGGSLEPESPIGGGIFGLVLDVVAPSGVITSLSSEPFSGTSSAAANFAGLMALQLADAGLSADPSGNLQRIELGDPSGDVFSIIVKALVDEFEPDNSIETAADIGASSVVVTGRMLSPSSDVDIYRVMVDGNRGIRVSMDSVGIIELLDADGKLIAAKSDADGGVFHDQLINDQAYIRVRPESGQINYGYRLDIEFFDLPLEAVELLSPAYGATDVDVNPVLSWSESPFEGVSYIVEVSLDESFGKVAIRQESTSNIAVTNELEHDTAYYWRVTTVDGKGQEAVSRTGSFTTVKESEVLEPVDDGEDGSSAVLSGGGGEPTEADSFSGGCTTGGSTGWMILVLLAATGAVLARRRSLGEGA